MTRPKRIDAYPPQFLHALQRVVETGEDLTIPTENPYSLRLAFYGLFGALRAENQPELPSLISILVNAEKSAIILRLKGSTEFAKDVETALKAAAPDTPSLPPATDYRAALERILNGDPE